MRIATVSAHFPPNFVSGGTLVPQRLSAAMQSRGHEVAVYAGFLDDSRSPYEVHEEMHEGLKIHWINISRFTSSADSRNWDNPPVTADFAAWLKEVRPEVVHFHSLQTLGAGLLEVAWAAGTRVVVTMHDLWWVCARQFMVDTSNRPCSLVAELGGCHCSMDHTGLLKRKQYMLAQLRRADLILLPSALMLRVLAANGVPAEKMRVSENGLTTELIQQNHPLVQDDCPVRFLYAGGASEVKGASTLAEAVKILGNQGGMTLDWYGFDRPVGSPRDWSHFHAAFAPAQLKNILSAHDVLVLPSVARESFSLLTREALLAGLAVITADSLGPEEVVEHGRNGLIIPAGDAVALAEAMRILAQERDTLNRLLNQGCSRSVLSFAQQVAQTEDVYRQITASIPEAEAVSAMPENQEIASIKRVLFVIGIQGAPLRYRTHLAVEALADQGVASTVRHYRDPRMLEDIKQTDAVVFYRVPATIQIRDLVAQIRALERPVPVLFDVDDLIFDSSLKNQIHGLEKLSQAELALWWRGVARYRTTLEMADVYLGSTERLCRHVTELIGIPTRRFANGTGKLLARCSEVARQLPRDPGPVRIGYFSGTTTHDEDWAFIEPAVVRVLQENPQVELWLGGYLEATPALEPFAKRVRKLPFAPWFELPKLLRQVDVCVAPLVPGSIFNESKSAIKWLEAALVGTPTVASDTQPFREAIRSGENGILAQSPADWYRALTFLTRNPAERTLIGSRALRSALLDYSPALQGRQYLGNLYFARDYVLTHGPRQSSSWEPVLDDEPLDTTECYVEPYEIPAAAREGLSWAHPPSWLGLKVAAVKRVYRAGGLRAVARKIVRALLPG